MKMKIDTARIIADFLQRNPSRAYKTKELARALLLARQGEEYQEMKKALREMQEAGVIERVDNRKWRIRRKEETVDGVITVTHNGWGLVHPFDAPSREIFIPRRAVRDARSGDRVRVAARSTGEGGREEGEIIEFLSGAGREVVGTLKTWRGRAFVEADGRNSMPDVAVPKAAVSKARDGDKVVVEISGRLRDDGEADGRIVEVIGKGGDPRVEMTALARRYGLSQDFPEEVEKEAAAIPASIPEEDCRGRLDLRDQVCFTIDPEDARDFDDAVSIGRDAEGNYLLGVHIADVGHYVPRGGALDREAYKRGTSVYLVNGVIPMLPERLSNHLCSLQEGRDRLAFSVLMTVTPRGALKAHEFRKSVIRSSRRFSYEEVEAIMDTGRGEFAGEIGLMAEIARVLTRKRFREGSIDFSVPEVKIELDHAGRPVDMRPRPRLRSMRLIEEFMLLANRCAAGVARKITGRASTPPFIYRVHDLPDPDKVRELTEFIRHLGLDIRLDPKSSKSFQKMIEALDGRPESAVVQDVTIRSMAKAVYSEKNIGHFGLGFALYTHFTSPIRRYPDLVAHRLIDGFLRGGVRGASAQNMADIARHSSERERLAVEAERESVRIAQAEYMRRFVGDEFEAIISGVTSYGLYVELVDSLAEGLVHVRSMGDDYYDFDSSAKQLVGRRKRRRYRLGDMVRVRLIRADVAERQLDFILLD